MEKSIHTQDYAAVLRLLKEARQEAGLTQVELADKLSLTQSQLSKMERGELRLDIIQLRIWCQTLGLTLSEFVRRLEIALAGDDEPG